MHRDSALIISTPNAYCLFRVIRYFFGIEMVHEDHNFYFSPRVLERLITRCGFRIVEMKYYGIGNELRSFQPRRYLWADGLARKIAPAMSDGLIVKAALA